MTHKIKIRTTWDDISELSSSNQQFTGCEYHIRKIVRSSKALSTNRKYEVYFRKFKEWCVRNAVNYSPASVASVAIYISGLVQQSVYESALLAHFYGIKWFHDFYLLENPCDNKLIHMMIEGSKRSWEASDKKGTDYSFTLGKNCSTVWRGS